MIDPFGRGRMFGSEIGTKEKTRLWFIAIGFVLVLGIFFGLQIWGAKTDESEEERGELTPRHPISVAASEDEEGRPLFHYQPRTPAERRDLSRDDMRERLGKFASEGLLLDASDSDEAEVQDYLLSEVLWNPSVTSVGPPFYALLDESKALFEPGPWRGSFVSAFGRVIDILPERPYEGSVKGVEKLYGVVFESFTEALEQPEEGEPAATGQLYHVLSASPIERGLGEWVQVYGVFYRLRPWEREGEKSDAISLMLVKKAKEAFPPRVVTEIDPAWASEVLERTFEDANNMDEPPLWLILNYVKNLGIDGYNELRESPGFKIHHFGYLTKKPAQDPEAYRFKFISGQGRMIEHGVDFAQTDNPGKIERVDSAMLLQPSEYLVQLVSPRPWTDYGVRLGQDFVQVEGIFYKRWKFEPRGGGGALEIPLLVVTGIYQMETESSSLMKFVSVLAGILGVGIVVVFLVLVLRDRKRMNEFRERFRDRTQRRRSSGDTTSE